MLCEKKSEKLDRALKEHAWNIRGKIYMEQYKPLMTFFYFSQQLLYFLLYHSLKVTIVVQSRLIQKYHKI